MKKIKKNILITLNLTFLFVSVTYSQKENLGYLGKKATVEFNLGTSYGLSTDLANNAHKNDRIFRPNFHPELTLAYTVKRNVDIGFKVGYDRVKVRFDNELEFSNVDPFYNPDLSTYNQYGDNSNSYFQLVNRDNVGRSFNYQFFVRLYSKKYIAPVGFYQQVSIGINRLSFKYNEIEGYMSSQSLHSRNSEEFVNNSIGDPTVIKMRKFNMFAFSYLLGNKKIYKNGFYSNIGIELNLFGKRELSGEKKLWQYLPVFDLFYTYEEPNINSDSYHYQYPKQLAKSIQRSQLIEFKIGIGKIF